MSDAMSEHPKAAREAIPPDEQSGFAVELVLSRYEVRKGKTTRENQASHYRGGLTEAEAEAIYAACDQAIDISPPSPAGETARFDISEELHALLTVHGIYSRTDGLELHSDLIGFMARVFRQQREIEASRSEAGETALERIAGYVCNNPECEQRFYVSANEEASVCPICGSKVVSALVGPFALRADFGGER